MPPRHPTRLTLQRRHRFPFHPELLVADTPNTISPDGGFSFNVPVA